MKLVALLALCSLLYFASSSLIQRRQRIVAKGLLLCGTKPAPNVQVSLVDYDPGPNPDDLMNKTKTNQDGEFYVDGMEEEISTIEPILKIYHDCNDGLPCQRYWKLKVPENYINGGDSRAKIFDIGTWNLELIMAGEGRDCIHEK